MRPLIGKHVGIVSREHRLGGRSTNLVLAVVGLALCGVVGVTYVLVIAHVLFGAPGGVAVWP